MSILKKALILPPILIAIALFMASGKVARPPQAATEKQEKATPVKVIPAKAVAAVPSVSRIWQGAAGQKLGCSLSGCRPRNLDIG